MDCSAAPSDAIVLFDGRNLDQWVMTNDRSPARWRVENGALVVDKALGNIETKRLFKDYQLHLEWRIPADITGEGQARQYDRAAIKLQSHHDPSAPISFRNIWVRELP